MLHPHGFPWDFVPSKWGLVFEERRDLWNGVAIGPGEWYAWPKTGAQTTVRDGEMATPRTFSSNAKV